MKVELVRFYVKPAALELYSIGTLGGPMTPMNYAEKDNRLGLYMGEDDDHVWILPLIMGQVLDDEGKPKTEPRIIVGSVTRFCIEDVVISEPDDYITDCPFGDMKWKGGSVF